MSSSLVTGKCIRNNLQFGDAPSHVTAKIFSEFSSHILIAFQRVETFEMIELQSLQNVLN